MGVTKKSLVCAGNDNVDQAALYVHQVSRWFRRRGLKASHAIQRASDQLGITFDLAWRLHYGHRIFSLSLSRLRQIELHYLASLDLEIAQMEEQTARLRVIKAELEMHLGGSVLGCSTDQSATSLLNSTSCVGVQLAFAAI